MFWFMNVSNSKRPISYANIIYLAYKKSTISAQIGVLCVYSSRSKSTCVKHALSSRASGSVPAHSTFRDIKSNGLPKICGDQQKLRLIACAPLTIRIDENAASFAHDQSRCKQATSICIQKQTFARLFSPAAMSHECIPYSTYASMLPCAT